MDDNKMIQGIKSLPLYAQAMEQLTVDPTSLTEEQKTYILTCAIILIRKYQKDIRCKSYLELAYYIILKYSVSFQDYEPLYDFSVNAGLYPVSQAITSSGLIDFDNLDFSLIKNVIEKEYRKDKLIETKEQKRVREAIMESEFKDISYVAPTSFGKSSLIVEHIKNNREQLKRIAIIVPTKSLLTQTYTKIKEADLGVKILIHDEMYNGENDFVAVYTQERALRLLNKHDIAFDILYIDEAHQLLERDGRAILLTRLIKLNKIRNDKTRVMYLSPLITDSDNIKIEESDVIFEQRIDFNVKEPDFFEYRTNHDVVKYNRFVDRFYKIDECMSFWQYIKINKTEKTFCYLYSPRKIEQFALELEQNLSNEIISVELEEIEKNLKKYVHEDFYEIEYLKKGIIYLHGKMPDNVKEYLEYKFSNCKELHYLVANKVVLEGVNLPVDSLFIMNGTNLKGKDLMNLIGRVNRLNEVFGEKNDLSKLMPKIHFVNSDEYNRKNGKLENKMRLLKTTVFPDDIKNPLLNKYDIQSVENSDVKEKCKAIVEEEKQFFLECTDEIQIFKKKLISVGLNSIYNLTDELCEMILAKIKKMKNHERIREIHFLDRLRYIFIRHADAYIVDDEFRRLNKDQAVAYYKKYFNDRKLPLNQRISMEIKYFHTRIEQSNSIMYIGESYGDFAYSVNGREACKKVYIDLNRMSEKQLANIAIVKQKIEDDFVSYKLNMFFQVMYDMNILTKEEYQMIVYGTTDKKKMDLVKMGLTINIINRLEKDKQIDNIEIDINNNFRTNERFQLYKKEVDDFYRFELDKFL